jgi:O-antigen ligase
MITPTVHRATSFVPLNLAGVTSVLALIGFGYAGVPNLPVVGAVAGCLALAVWVVIAFQQPGVATGVSFAAVLAAGTKFRLRDATDSLAGVMDAQVALELALYACAGAALLGACASRRFPRTRVSAAEWLVLGYAALALISSGWSRAPALTFVRAVQLAIIAGVAIAAVRILSPSSAMWTASRALAIYVVACALSTAVFAAETTFDPEDTSFRFAWFAVHPITAGTLAAIAALAMFSPSLFERSDANRIAGLPRWLLTTGLAAILILTRARGPLLAFVAAIAVLMLMRASWRMRFALAGVASACLFVYLAVGADFRDWLDAASSNRDATVNRMFFRGHTADRVLSLNGRLDLWSDLSPTISANPVLGHGFQASRAVVLDAAPWAAYAHNALLQGLLDLGLVGAAALIALVGTAGAGALRCASDRWLQALTMAMMVFLTLNSISTESFAGSPGVETLLLFLCVLCTTSPRPAGRGVAAPPSRLPSVENER